MNITKEQAAMLGRRAQQPTREPGELLVIFVRGKLVNTANRKWGWRGLMGYRQRWKEAVSNALLEAPWRTQRLREDRERTAQKPKVIRFIASTARTMDTDGLQASLKCVRDSLQECGVIHSDAPDSGHEFVYEQRIDRARRGVEIRVRLRDDGHPRRTAPSKAERTRG